MDLRIKRPLSRDDSSIVPIKFILSNTQLAFDELEISNANFTYFFETLGVEGMPLASHCKAEWLLNILDKFRLDTFHAAGEAQDHKLIKGRNLSDIVFYYWSLRKLAITAAATEGFVVWSNANIEEQVLLAKAQ